MTSFELREPSGADAAAIAGLLNAITEAQYGEGDVDAEVIAAWLREPDLEILLAERERELVGYGDIGWRKERPDMYWLDIRVLRGSGAASPLMDALEPRAVPQARPPALVRGFVPSVEPDLAATFSARGYRVIRHAFRMRRELDEPVEHVSLPPGFELRPHRSGEEERVYEAHMESFADHWEFHGTSLEDWRRWRLEWPGTDSSLWQLAYEGDELAGICLCRRYSSEQPEFGWIDILGVRPRWRRRGLARALLLHAFQEFQRRGFDSVGLGVDGENTTGAVRLYERVGMSVHRRHEIFERAFG